MTDKEKLFKAFEDTIWCGIRYANGRHTYAPSMIRDSIKLVQEVYPDWKPKHDHTIKADMENGWAGNESSLPSDYLVDLFEEPEPKHRMLKSGEYITKDTEFLNNEKWSKVSYGMIDEKVWKSEEGRFRNSIK